MHIDKICGNVQDQYSSKCLITNLDRDFNTMENNLEFAYYCLHYHFKYLIDNYKNVSKIGVEFGFHYHIFEQDEWYYFEVEISNFPENYSIHDFLNKKGGISIRMKSSLKVIDKTDIEFLNKSLKMN